MADIEKVIYDSMDIKERNKLSEYEMQTIDNANELLREQEDLGEELTNAVELILKKNERIKKLEEQIETLTRWRANAGAFD